MPPKRAAAARKSVQPKPHALEEDIDGGDEEYGDLREKERNLKNSMVVDANLRKGVRQRHLEDAFENQVRELDDHIDERVEEYEQETKRAQDAFVMRLLALTQKKADVERQIVQHVQELAEAYDVVKAEFHAVLKGRSEDVHAAMNTLRGLQGDDNPSLEGRQ